MRFIRELSIVALSLILSFSVSAQYNPESCSADERLTSVETLCIAINDIYESSQEYAQKEMKILFADLKCSKVVMSVGDNVSVPLETQKTPSQTLRFEGFRPEQRVGSFCETPTGACTVVTQRINSLCKCGDSYGRIVR